MSFTHLFHFASSAGDIINRSASQACGTNCGGSLPAAFSAIANTLIFLVGSISVIMIIVGGLRYVISNGDPKQAEVGRNTILYAVIGVVVSLLSYAIVNFVVTAL